jgi:hypothetical protein
VPDVERPKAPKLNRIASKQRILQAVEDGLDRNLGLPSGHAPFLEDALNEAGPSHAATPMPT